MSSLCFPEQVEVALDCCIARVDFQRALVLCDGLGDPLQLTQRVASAYRHTQVHLFQPLGFGTFGSKPVSEVFDEADSFVALANDAVKLILCK